MLADVLASGRFTVTAEFGPPVDPDAELVRSAARALAPVVDAANVTDNQAATVKLSPLACSAWMLEEGLEPIMQITGRDRNLMSLQSDLLAAWAFGVRTVLGLTGDLMKVGKYEGLATQVGDLDSNGLAKLIANMNAGTLAAGEALSSRRPSSSPAPRTRSSTRSRSSSPSSRPASASSSRTSSTTSSGSRPGGSRWCRRHPRARAAARRRDAAALHADAAVHAREDPRGRGRRRDVRAPRGPAGRRGEGRRRGGRRSTSSTACASCRASPACTSWPPAGRSRPCRGVVQARASPACDLPPPLPPRPHPARPRARPRHGRGAAAGAPGPAAAPAPRPARPGAARRGARAQFPSPLGLAAGVDKDATWFEGLGAIGFGFVEIGTVTAQAQPGNPAAAHRALPAGRALLNRMGFPNGGRGGGRRAPGRAAEHRSSASTSASRGGPRRGRRGRLPGERPPARAARATTSCST